MSEPWQPQQPAYHHNGQQISPEAFYAIACDPQRSVAVEACAGAGKTWMLVSRIVRALLDGVDAQSGQLRVQPHEILAITFTKRAASEMRERLYQWLSDFATADHQTLIQELRYRGVQLLDAPQGAALPQQLCGLYQSILNSARQVQVRTFHSWFAALLRSAPLATLQQMGLPSNYELLEDDGEAKALVWRRFYAALVADASARVDFEAVVLAYGRSQTDKALQTALDKRTEFALADAQGLVDGSVQHFCDQFPEFAWLTSPADYLRAQAQRWQTMLDAAKALGGASAKTFSAKGVELETAMTADDFPGMVVALLTEKGSPRKFGEKIAGIERVREAQDLVLRVVAAQAQDAAWQYQQRMARLARLLLREYAALKRERGWVDMNDVERAAQSMLSDPVLSGWVQERLDARIKHLLIDEFQDTNPLQWQALRSWLSGYAGAGSQPPSVFLVGDPKQSIYRFRRAEPQVFKAAKVFVREGLGGDVLSCDHTRRNATGVIATVNAAMLEASQTDGYEGFRAHTTSAVTSGRVCKLPQIARAARATAANDVDEWRDSLVTPRELPEEGLRTLEARQAAQWIARQLVVNAEADPASNSPGLRPSDVMVLSRRRASLMPLQDELRKLGMAAQIGEKTELIDCCEVQDLVALLDVLVSKQHDLSLARVLKSPLFGLDDQALVQLVLQQAQPPMPWLELVQQQALRAPDGRSVGACLLRWKAWLDSLPPHDALQNIYFDGDVLARFAAAAPANQREAVQANLKSLLGVSLQLGGGRFATPYALVRALKSGGVLAPAALNPDAVRLLTIHGAKGLEAELVLLLDTDTPERNADTMGVLVDWPGHSAWPLKFVFLASEKNPPACAVHALEIERLEREREELNALYVALTRSRNTLVFSSIEPYRAAERSWWQRLSPLALEVQASELLAPSIAAAAHESDVFCIKELPLLAMAKAADVVSGTLTTGSKPVPPDADSVAARVGQAMHRLLEWGDVSEPGAAAAAREFELSPEQGLQAAVMAQRILQGDAAWAWDQALLSWQGNEVELMYQGQTLRLDRLVQRKDAAHPGHWWVLDFKSAQAPHEQPELVAQLRSYQAAVQAIYPNELVRAAFLTPQGALLEVTNE